MPAPSIEDIREVSDGLRDAALVLVTQAVDRVRDELTNLTREFLGAAKRYMLQGKWHMVEMRRSGALGDLYALRDRYNAAVAQMLWRESAALRRKLFMVGVHAVRVSLERLGRDVSLRELLSVAIEPRGTRETPRERETGHA